MKPSAYPWLAALALCALPSIARSGLVSVELLSNSGPAIRGLVDTTADTFRIDSWTDPTTAPALRVPASGAFPLTLSAFTMAGAPFDVPDLWNGAIGSTVGWVFLLPPGQDLLTVPCIQGPPDNFWSGASFGWGGLRNRLGNIVLNSSANAFSYVPYVDPARGTGSLTFQSITIRPIPEPSTALFSLALCLSCAARPRRPPRMVRPDERVSPTHPDNGAK